MLNIIDFIGIAIIIISAIIAFKKGFVKTFFDFVSTFLALILAFMLCNLGVSIIKNSTGIDEWLHDTLTASLNVENNEDGENIEEEPIEEKEETENSDMFLSILQNLPKNIQDFVGLEEYKEDAKETIVEGATEIILKIMSWVVIYLLVRLILLILCLVFNGIMNISFLKQINNLAGLIIGVLLGFFRIYVILAFVSFLAPVVSMEGFIELIKSSLMIGVMYENNILISLFF